MAGGNNKFYQLLQLEDSLYKAARLTTPPEKPFATSFDALAPQRKEIASLLSLYSEQLKTLNPVMFKFSSEIQREQYRKQLLFTLYLFYAQHQIDEAEGRKRALQESVDGINKCLKRLQDLKLSAVKADDDNQLQAALNDSEKYLKYLGLTLIAPWIVNKMMAVVDGETKEEVLINTGSENIQVFAVKDTKTSGIAEGGKNKFLIDKMSELNMWRLFWVWAGALDASIVDLLPDDFDHKAQAQAELASPSPVMGYMSWILYYTRFGINLLLLLKHTFGWGISDEEAKVPAWERFKTQWQQRKFALLNDSIWATANLVCFFWLRGPGMMGYGGNLLTAVLLLMDLSLNIWRFMEESTRHNAEVLALNKRKKELTKALNMEKGRLDVLNKDKGKNAAEIKKSEAKQEELQAQLRQLKKTIVQNETAWKYKKYSLINDTAYAAGLLFAFSLLCCFFFPPAAIAPAVVMILGVAGAALCFTLTLLTAAVSGGIEIARAKESAADVKAQCRVLLGQFIKADDENTKKLLYLEMKGLMAESNYQQAVARFQMVKLVRSVFVDALIPALVFASVVFMPMGIGLAVMAAGLAVALISHLILSRFAPQREDMGDLAKFEEEKFDSEFSTFANNLESKSAESDKNIEKIKDKELVALFAAPKPQKQSKPGCFGLFASNNEKPRSEPSTLCLAGDSKKTN
ncbi:MULTISPECIES: hypothetical protein [unclassified Legionella]|uniref:hypothetical protein n=1 Tax=unclassified Legionella TaxID=2622702 RepID=UPI001055D094|nr:MULTISPECIES: hypothetical protein [unclassified Legionella]MDI9819523.1 hypothetical protein [Legionella sp. PL877]